MQIENSFFIFQELRDENVPIDCFLSQEFAENRYWPLSRHEKHFAEAVKPRETEESASIIQRSCVFLIIGSFEAGEALIGLNAF